jgi:hypothetical protein
LKLGQRGTILTKWETKGYPAPNGPRATKHEVDEAITELLDEEGANKSSSKGSQQAESVGVATIIKPTWKALEIWRITVRREV